MRPDERKVIERLRNATYAVNDEGLVGKAMELRDAIDDLEALLDPAPADQGADRTVVIYDAAGVVTVDGVEYRRVPDQGAEGRGGEIPLYRWRLNEDSPWRVTDWDGVPDDIEQTSDLCRLPDTEITDGLVRVELTREEASEMEEATRVLDMCECPHCLALRSIHAKLSAALADEGETE